MIASSLLPRLQFEGGPHLAPLPKCNMAPSLSCPRPPPALCCDLRVCAAVSPLVPAPVLTPSPHRPPGTGSSEQ